MRSRSKKYFDRRTFLYTVSFLFLIIALAYLGYSALLQPSGQRWGDFRYLYVAGVSWNSGIPPYDPKIFLETWLNTINGIPLSERPYPGPAVETVETLRGLAVMYAYPPSSFFLVSPLAEMGWTGARIGMTTINIIAILLSGLILSSIYRLNSFFVIILFSLFFLMSATSSNLFVGQTSLIALSAAMLTILASRWNSTILFMVGVSIAALKPQLSVLFLFYAWLLVDRKALFGVLAAALVVTINLLPILLFKDWGFFLDFRRAASIHVSQGFNQLENMHGGLFLLSNLAERGIVLAGNLIAGVFAVVAVWLLKFRVPLGLAMVSMMSMMTLPIHAGYDLVVAYPLIAFALLKVQEWTFDRKRNLLEGGVVGLLILLSLVLVRWNNVDNLAESYIGMGSGEYVLISVVLVAIVLSVVLDCCSQDLEIRDVEVGR